MRNEPQSSDPQSSHPQRPRCSSAGRNQSSHRAGRAARADRFPGARRRGCAALAGGRGSAREAVVVSTCNRAELYVACDEAAATRQDLVRFVSDFNGVDAARHRAARLRRRRSRRRAPPVPRRRRPRFARRGRAADPRTGEGCAHRRRRRATPPARCSTACSTLVRGRQARADRNRPRVGRGVGQLRGGRAGAQDFRRSRAAAASR